MVFNSIQYLAFLPITVILYYVFPSRFRWIFLLAASYFFYACWNIGMLAWLCGVTLISYLAGIAVAPDRPGAVRKSGIWLGILSLCGLLFAFKYTNFFMEQIEGIAGLFGSQTVLPRVDWIMPIGISFFTFQAMGYVFDVYRGKVKPAFHIGKYALFIGFFPHLAEGPIDRANNLLPQIDETHRFDYTLFSKGFLLIIFGLFKKMVIADRLAVLVNTVFNNPTAFHGGEYWIASLFYTFQIYCDFSGYTDIAVGSANLMGFHLVENFNAPYLATSIGDFWRRWHMSLSRWFRDYLYIPLGGNRVSFARWCLNVMIVFLVSSKVYRIPFV